MEPSAAENGSWSVEKEVQDIAALIEAHGGKASIYGHSSGAVLALEAALRLEGMVEKVVVYDASYVSDESDQEEFRALKVEVKGLLDHDQRAQGLRVFLAGGEGPPSIQKVFRIVEQAIPHAEAALLPGQDHMASMKALLPPMLRFLV